MGNHYLIKTVYGEIIHIYFMKGNGICVEHIGSNQMSEILLKDGFYDFDCWYSKQKNEIHLVCQNSEGSIYHILYQSGEWKKKELLSGKLKLPYPKHFKILSVGGKVIFFYTIRHDGNLLLVSQWIGEQEMPLVIDYVNEESQTFLCDAEEEKPYVIYKNGKGEIERKVLEEKHWKKRMMAINIEGEIPVSFCRDLRGNFHFLTCCQHRNQTEFFYRIKNKNIWSEKTPIFHVAEPPIQTVFLLEENVPTVAFFTRNEIRIFHFRNHIWEESPVKERLIHRLKRPIKIQLLQGIREETVGSIQEGRVELVFKRTFLLKNENQNDFNQEKKGMDEKITELEKTVKELESKIASLQEQYKRG